MAESESDTDSSYESIDEELDESINEIINDDVTIKLCNAYEVKKMIDSREITNYQNQRPIDKDHIKNTLLPGIQNTRKVYGTVLIAEYRSEQFIMNGQHRIETFKLMNTNDLKEIMVILEFRKIKHKKELINLYNDSNCHQLFNVKKLDGKIGNLMDIITDTWSNFIRPKQKNKNRIDSRELRKKIEERINFDFSENKFMELLKIENNKYLDMCFERALSFNSKLKEEHWTKFKKDGFALGIDKKFIYIDQIREEFCKQNEL